MSAASDDTDVLLRARPCPVALETEELLLRVDSLDCRLESLETASRSRTFPERGARRSSKGARMFKAGARRRLDADYPESSPSSVGSRDSFLDISPMNDPVLTEIDKFLLEVGLIEADLAELSPFRDSAEQFSESKTEKLLSKYICSNDDLKNVQRYQNNIKSRIQDSIQNENDSTFKKLFENNSQKENAIQQTNKNQNNTSRFISDPIKSSSDYNVDSDRNAQSKINQNTSKRSINSISDDVVKQDVNKNHTDYTNSMYKLFDVEKSNVKNTPNPNRRYSDRNISRESTFSRNPLLEMTDRLETLPVLSDLWSTVDSKRSKDHNITQKIEEERLRREHCESEIHRLQKQILEQRQQLAVAVEVDTAKENVIDRLKKACFTAVHKAHSLEESFKRENSNLGFQIRDLHSLLFNGEAPNKNYEDLPSLIVDCKKRMISFTSQNDNEKHQLLKNIEEMKILLEEKDGRISELKESHGLVVQLNKQLTENIESIQRNVSKTSEENKKISDELKSMENIKDRLEVEISELKSDKNELSKKLVEERSSYNSLKNEKITVEKTLEDAHNKIRLLESEFETYKNTAQCQRNDLKVYYQKQVEDIVDSKAADFRKEMENKEKDIALQFARHLQKVEQHHLNEMNILEEKHKEYLKLYKIQLNKCNQTIQQLEDKILSLKNKRCEVAAQLHSVMENQWQQALKIITNESSKESPTSVQSNCDNAAKNENVQHKLQNTKEKEKIDLGENNSVKISNEQLQHYVKMLLQKVPVKHNENTQKSDFDSVADRLDFEYPTSDKAVDDERKMDSQSRTKPPWR